MLQLKSLCFFAFLLVIVSTVFVTQSSGSGGVDPSFNAQLQTTTYQPKDVTYLATQPDGKILAGGKFNTYNGQPVGALIRLNQDASLDTSFNNYLVDSGNVDVTLLPTGKLLIKCFNVTLSNGVVYTNTLIRLNADGTFDSSFNYPYTGNIYGVTVDSSGRVIVYGPLSVVINGMTLNKGIIRLTDDGTYDTSFNGPDYAPARDSLKVTAQKNKILNCFNDVFAQQLRVVRLNEDGSSDDSFTAPLIGNLVLIQLVVQPDDKILVQANSKLLRLNGDGTVDSAFQNPITSSMNDPRMRLQNDGRITIAHQILGVNGRRIIRLLQNGTDDPSFSPYFFAGDYFGSYDVQEDGGVLIGDANSTTGINRFMRLLPTGLADTSFNPGGEGFQTIRPGQVRAVSVQADEKILIGGDFDKVGGAARPKLARLDSDGALDNSFQINTSGSGDYFSQILDIYHFAVQSDGKIIISGSFKYFVGGVVKNNIVRLNSDGSIDNSFRLSVAIGDTFTIFGYGSNKPLQRSDGKVLIGKMRANNDPVPIPLLLTADGQIDTTFNPGLYSAASLLAVYDIALQPDGKILVAGKFEIPAGGTSIQKGFLLRLNSDGTIDQTFQPSELSNQIVFTVNLLDNGQILVNSGTTSQNNLSRLNSNGTIDNSFNTGAGANGRINALAVLPDHRIVIGGAFSLYNGQSRQNLALLQANGNLAEDIGGSNRPILSVVTDSHGRVLVGGQFTAITSGQNGSTSTNSTADGKSAVSVAQSYVARLTISPAAVVRTPFDFDGDGRADISVFRPGTGIWYLLNSNSGFTTANFGLSSDKLAAADYDGDGKTDLAVFRPSTGTWYLQQSTAGFTAVRFGQAGDIPVPADYDGDGKADIVVFRPSDGNWYFLKSTTGFSATHFGLSGDIPVAADYDGDGRADVAVFRPSGGYWYISGSEGNSLRTFKFGQSGDVPVAADYDGDGKANIAVYRAGTWYINGPADQFAYYQFGSASDIPVPADYDGDGKADYGVFRPSNGYWYIQKTQAGLTALAFGTSTDNPVPNSSVTGAY
jgi:uncharacterized delta-60 repeat protein